MLNEVVRYHIAQIIPLLTVARSHVEQLVMVTGGSWQSRTALLKAIAEDQGFDYKALSLLLVEALLGQAPRHRPLYTSETIDQLVRAAPKGIVLDQIEILFDPELQIDPLRFIRNLSHSQLILLSWPGTIEASRLIYARPGHPEYRVYQISDTLVYSLENAA